MEVKKDYSNKSCDIDNFRCAKSFQMVKQGERDTVNKSDGSSSNILEIFSRFVDENKRIITYSFYGVSVAGVFIAIRSLNLFKQFKNIGEISSVFVQKNNSIFGIVEKNKTVVAADTGTNVVHHPRIYISHIPIFGKQIRSKETEICVKLIGVSLDINYVKQWEQKIESMSETKVKVKIFGKADPELHGKVSTKRFGFWRECIASNLLRKGHGHFDKTHFKNAIFNPELASYQNSLLKHENFAKRKKIGVWQASTGNEKKKDSVIDKILDLFRRSK